MERAREIPLTVFIGERYETNEAAESPPPFFAYIHFCMREMSRDTLINIIILAHVFPFNV
jgi:hypothetical protein